MKIVVLDGFSVLQNDLSLKKLEKFGKLTIFERSLPTQVLERAKDANIILTNKIPITATHFEQLPKLKYIGVLATGYNIIDIEAAKKHGVIVTNAKNYGANAVAQHTWALILESINHVAIHDQTIREDWVATTDWCYAKRPITCLTGKYLGIVGLGAIGRQVAKIAKAFGMKIMALESDFHTPTPKHIKRVDTQTLFEKADILTLHCPLTAKTKEIINKNTLSLMKKNAILINTGRGGLINEQDLAEALCNNSIAGAALDVLSTEPPTLENPLLNVQNCILTPHNAWLSFEARERLLEIVIDNITAFLKGKPINMVV